MAIRPILTTGMALAGAGAIVVATPALMVPTDQVAVAASEQTSPTGKRTLSVDQLRLLALSDITLEGLVDVFAEGYGAGVGADDPYYPVDDPIYVTGFTGLGYYLGDQVLDSLVLANLPLVSDLAQFAYDNVTSYYFEIGATAALHVALAEATGGPDTDFAQLLQLIFNPLGVILAQQNAGLALAASPDAVSPLALSDVTFQDLVDVFLEGYGAGVGADDPYYPVDDPIYVTGFTGLGYYLGDQVLDSLVLANLPLVSDLAQFAYDNVTSYYFEIGATAALHVALAEATGGPDTDFAQLLKVIFNPLGSILNPQSAGVALAAAPAAVAPSAITLEGFVEAFVDGYGGRVLTSDAYYPVADEDYPIEPSALTGVAYYLGDQALTSVADAEVPLVSELAKFAYQNITRYYFEIGAPAALHVSLAEATGGPDTDFARLLQGVFNPSSIELAAEESELESLTAAAGSGAAARALVAADAGEADGPGVLPKKPAAVVDVSVGEGTPADESEKATPADPDADADKAGDEAGAGEGNAPVKSTKGPKLNVKKDNPLSGLNKALDDVKDNVEKSTKKLGDDLKKLTDGLGSKGSAGSTSGGTAADGESGGDDSGGDDSGGDAGE